MQSTASMVMAGRRPRRCAFTGTKDSWKELSTTLGDLGRRHTWRRGGSLWNVVSFGRVTATVSSFHAGMFSAALRPLFAQGAVSDQAHAWRSRT